MYFQKLVRWQTRGTVRGVEEIRGVDMSEEIKRWAEDTLFCLHIHAHPVAQGRA